MFARARQLPETKNPAGRAVGVVRRLREVQRFENWKRLRAPG
jgi:hypothetical protein